jgi:hypothetical protein
LQGVYHRRIVRRNMEVEAHLHLCGMFRHKAHLFQSVNYERRNPRIFFRNQDSHHSGPVFMK